MLKLTIKDIPLEENAIIQKKFFHNKNGSIIIYSIDDEETIPEHKTKNYEFIYVLNGTIEVIIEENYILASKNSFYTIAPNQKHTINGYKNGKFALVIFKDKK